MFGRGERYRLSAATIALRPNDTGHKVAVTLPLGAVVEILEDSATDLVAITWKGKPYEMFSKDLRERGEEVASASERLPSG